jgi:hypothetical protein
MGCGDSTAYPQIPVQQRSNPYNNNMNRFQQVEMVKRPRFLDPNPLPQHLK